jgi:hypothetical protein
VHASRRGRFEPAPETGRHDPRPPVGHHRGAERVAAVTVIRCRSRRPRTP